MCFVIELAKINIIQAIKELDLGVLFGNPFLKPHFSILYRKNKLEYFSAKVNKIVKAKLKKKIFSFFVFSAISIFFFDFKCFFF